MSKLSKIFGTKFCWYLTLLSDVTVWSLINTTKMWKQNLWPYLLAMKPVNYRTGSNISINGNIWIREFTTFLTIDCIVSFKSGVAKNSQNLTKTLRTLKPTVYKNGTYLQNLQGWSYVVYFISNWIIGHMGRLSPPLPDIWLTIIFAWIENRW